MKFARANFSEYSQNIPIYSYLRIRPHVYAFFLCSFQGTVERFANARVPRSFRRKLHTSGPKPKYAPEPEPWKLDSSIF